MKRGVIMSHKVVHFVKDHNFADEQFPSFSDKMRNRDSSTLEYVQTKRVDRLSLKVNQFVVHCSENFRPTGIWLELSIDFAPPHYTPSIFPVKLFWKFYRDQNSF